MANNITLVPTAVQGSKEGTFNVQAGNPAHIQVDMVSSVYPNDDTLTFDLEISRSFDGGQTFTPWGGAGSIGGGAGQPGKGGVPMSGLYSQIFQWDGLAATMKVTITVNTPFEWGLTGTVLPS